MTGDLSGADGQTLTGDGLYDLVVDAEDLGAEDTATSGVKSLTVKLDGQTVVPTQTNPGCTVEGCPAEYTWEPQWRFDPSAWGDGSHVVEVVVEDAAGNQATEEIRFESVGFSARPADAFAVSSGADLTVVGGSAGDRLGQSVASVGDIDGDGLDDMAVGAPGADYAGRLDAGAVYVLLGKDFDGGGTVAASDPDLRVFGGAEAMDGAGAAVAGAGDVNGDGYDDFVVGAPGLTTLVQVQGSAFVVFGGPEVGSQDLASLASAGRGYEIRGPLVSSVSLPLLLETVPLGAQVAQRERGDRGDSGDVNGDGLDDVVLGASGESPAGRLAAGVTYVIYGKTTTSTVDLAAANGSPSALGAGFRVLGGGLLERSGEGTALPGDINVDGRGGHGDHGSGRQSVRPHERGSAFVIFGKATGEDVDLAQPLGGQGYRVSGAPNDQLTTAGSVGDVNGDTVPDFLLGGLGAAWVMYGQPSGEPVDLAAQYAGYRMTGDPAAGVARVAGVGDVDRDTVADGALGFPQAGGGEGVGYLTYGNVSPRSLVLGALSGERGALIAPPGAGAQLGAAGDGTESTADGTPRSYVGAPGALGARGAVYATPSDAYARAAARAPAKCVARTRAPTYPFDGRIDDIAQPLPACRRALKGSADVPFGKVKPYSSKVKCTEPVPGGPPLPTGEPAPPIRDGCLPSAYSGGNRGILTAGLAERDKEYKMVDSSGKGIVKITQRRAYCYEVRTADDPSQPIGFTTDDNASCDAPQNKKTRSVKIELQGRACMDTKKLEDAHWYVRFVRVKGKPRFQGAIQGFMLHDDLKLSTSPAKAARFAKAAENAYTGCGQPQQGLKPTPLNGPLTRFNAPGLPSPSDPGDQHQTPTSLLERDQCNRVLPCYPGTPYANYQSPKELDDIGLDLVYLTTASTQVSGTGSPGNSVGKDINGGGIVRAVLRRSAVTELYDEFGYADVNVPCGAPRTGRWLLVGGRRSGARRIVGWAPARVDGQSGSHCEAPVLVDVDAQGPLGPPAIIAPKGLLQPGVRLTAQEGSWTGPPIFEYQWLRCLATDQDSCTPIAGQTTKNYLVDPADVGSLIRFDVTAKNKRKLEQLTVARSTATPVVTASPGP